MNTGGTITLVSETEPLVAAPELFCVVRPLLTVTVNDPVEPVPVGVPLITPLANVNPAGNGVEPLNVYVNGPVPVTGIVYEYGTPIVGAGGDTEPSTGRSCTMIVYVTCASGVVPFEPVTVNESVSAVDGAVPESTPVVEFNDTHDGNEPVDTVHDVAGDPEVKLGVRLNTPDVCTYHVTADGYTGANVVTVVGITCCAVNDDDTTAPDVAASAAAAFVTVNVIDVDPAAVVGVPVISPVDVFNDNPAGNPVTEYVNGPVPDVGAGSV